MSYLCGITKKYWTLIINFYLLTMKRFLSLLVAIIVAIPCFAQISLGEVVKTQNEPNYLRFTAETDGSTVALRKRASSSSNPFSLQYKKNDGEWTDLIIQNYSDTTSGIITLEKKNDYVLIRAKKGFKCKVSSGQGDGSCYKSANDATQYGTVTTNIPGLNFVMTGSILGSGNIMSLIDSTCNTGTVGDRLFCGLFMGCKSLKTAPELPADTLGRHCYHLMFADCINLKETPRLPAKRLAGSCYSEMFCNCTGLTSISEFEAESLESWCFYRMFWGCTSLKKLPEFNPDWTLKDGCFADIYRDCTSLEVAPKLPYTTLADYCYSYMFKGCTSLKRAPFLPATKLAPNCCQVMFDGCSNLSEIHVNTNSFSNSFGGWVVNVSPTGKFYCPAGLERTFGTSYIPKGWEVISRDLCFTALEAGSTISMKKVGMPASISLQYSRKGLTWTDFIVGTTTITLANKGDKVYFRAKDKNQAMATGYTNYHSFVMTGKIAASGDIMSLLDNTIDPEEVPSCGFLGLFRGCSSLVEAPNLPAMKVKYQGYRDLFYNCTNLTKAPELPATELGTVAYYSMFLGCDKLTEAPKLIAKKIESQCYRNMFHDCHSLKIAPELPLTNAADYGYGSIFKNCYNLEEIHVNFPQWNSNLTYTWVDGVRNECGTFYGPSTLSTKFGISYIPRGWKHVYSDYLIFNDAECYSEITDTVGLGLNYIRNFDNVDWEPLYVPFNINVSDLQSYGLSVAELYGICGKDNDGDGVYESVDLQFNTLKDGIVYANQPYLIRSNEEGKVVMHIQGNVLNPALENSITCSTFKQNFTVTGTYSGLSEEEMTENGYYTMYDGSLNASNEDLMPQRWYMSISNKDGSSIVNNAPSVRVVIDGIIEESASGIQELSVEPKSSSIFTLDGRNAQSRSLKPGFNIINGKKVFIR